MELEFEPEALTRVAEIALARKTGARGLRGVLENVMTDIMFRIPSDETVNRVVITPEAVSYTHLDVYKRQELLSVQAPQAIIERYGVTIPE